MTYIVRYRITGDESGDVREASVAVIPGYSTFESIRTIIAVKNTGRQDPEIIDVLSVERAA